MTTMPSSARSARLPPRRPDPFCSISSSPYLPHLPLPSHSRSLRSHQRTHLSCSPSSTQGCTLVAVHKPAIMEHGAVEALDRVLAGVVEAIGTAVSWRSTRPTSRLQWGDRSAVWPISCGLTIWTTLSACRGSVRSRAHILTLTHPQLVVALWALPVQMQSPTSSRGPQAVP